MKKQMLFPMIGMLLLLSVSCAGEKVQQTEEKGETAGQDKPADETEEAAEGEQISVLEDEEQDQAVFREPEAWEQAYLEYLDTLQYGESCTYSLIYVDEDEIPELVIDAGYEAGGCRILTWHEDRLDMLQTNRLNFTYVEKGNLLCNSDGNMGYYYDLVYTIENGKWKNIGEGIYTFGEDGIQQDENGDFIYEYSWMEQPVDQSEYERQFHAIYPETEGKVPEQYEILKEIRSILETKEIASAAHRYELAVEDLTWS